MELETNILATRHWQEITGGIINLSLTYFAEHPYFSDQLCLDEIAKDLLKDSNKIDLLFTLIGSHSSEEWQNQGQLRKTSGSLMRGILTELYDEATTYNKLVISVENGLKELVSLYDSIGLIGGYEYNKVDSRNFTDYNLTYKSGPHPEKATFFLDALANKDSPAICLTEAGSILIRSHIAGPWRVYRDKGDVEIN